jgi:hypothetical protein
MADCGIPSIPRGEPTLTPRFRSSTEEGPSVGWSPTPARDELEASALAGASRLH